MRRILASFSSLGAAMLGSKKKRVAVYGKRAHWVIASDDPGRTTVNRRTTTSPPVAVIVLDDPASDTSPVPSPVKPKKSTTRKKVVSKPANHPEPARHPLIADDPMHGKLPETYVNIKSGAHANLNSPGTTVRSSNAKSVGGGGGGRSREQFGGTTAN
jgi:hypothetical protein